MSKTVATQEELSAFVSQVYAETHATNDDVLRSQGVDPQEVADQSHATLEHTNDCGHYRPDRQQVAAAISHVLTSRLPEATDGPLAAMGERARQHQELFSSLGTTGLRGWLVKEMDWLTTRLYVTSRAMRLPNFAQVRRLYDYTLLGDAPGLALPHLVTKKGRAVRRMLNDVIFDKR